MIVRSILSQSRLLLLRQNAAGGMMAPISRRTVIRTKNTSAPSNFDEYLTLWGDQRRMYPLPRKRSLSALPLDIKHTDKMIINRRGMALYTQTYEPPLTEPRGIVFLMHAYGDHSSWCFRDLAIHLVLNNYKVIAMDYQGHGRSDGLRGLIDIEETLQDLCDHYGGISVEQHKPCFLLGEGLGGALAYKTYLIQGGRFWDGCILLSPTLAFPRRLRLPPLVCKGLKRYEHRIGAFPLVPYSRLVIDLLKDPSKRQDMLENPLFVRHGMRVSSFLQIQEMTDEVQHSFEDLTAPFLILHGDQDPLHDPEVSQNLYRRGKSLDKAIKTYANLQHSLLLGGESDENVQKVYDDLVEWLHERTAFEEGEEDDDEEEDYLEEEGRH